jgi:hypothetical protein
MDQDVRVEGAAFQIKNKTQTKMTATLATIANYRNQLNVLEQLIEKRASIKARILEIDNTLKGILKHVSHKRRHTGDALAPRLEAICSRHPEGATLQHFIEELGVTKSTASTYVYNSLIGGKLLHRDYDANGKPVWFFKHN